MGAFGASCFPAATSRSTVPCWTPMHPSSPSSRRNRPQARPKATKEGLPTMGSFAAGTWATRRTNRSRTPMRGFTARGMASRLGCAIWACVGREPHGMLVGASVTEAGGTAEREAGLELLRKHRSFKRESPLSCRLPQTGTATGQVKKAERNPAWPPSTNGDKQ